MASLEEPPYLRLKAWQACFDLAVELYRTTNAWPRQERFELTSQVRRAAYSAGANLAEGCAKSGPREFRRYADISAGSLAELSFALRLAHRVGFLAPAEFQRLDQMQQRASQLVGGLARGLRRASERLKAAKRTDEPRTAKPRTVEPTNRLSV